MPRPPVRKTFKLAKAQRLGELKAELQFHRNKPLKESFREHIGKMIDRLDPMETLAIGSGTLLIHQFILKDTDTLTKIANAFSTVEYGLANPWMVWLQGMTGYLGLGFLFGGPPQQETGKSLTGSPELDQIMLWMLSFLIAVMLVKYGGQIFGMLGKGLGGMAGIIGLFL
jgi:hypothetical protein